MDDIAAIWHGHSAESLARRFQALAALYRVRGGFQLLEEVALDIERVVLADYDPRPGRRPQLGDPPTARIRRAAPEPGS